MLLTCASVLGLVGLGFCLYGIHLALETALGPVVAALLTGLASLMLMLVVLWIAMRLSR